MKNPRRVLDELSLVELGVYVYGLSDPQSNRVLYVGKGGGKFEDGSGNLRVFSHFREAERELEQAENDASFRPSAKCLAIQAVWSRGEDVRVSFYRRRLRDELEAYHVEAAVIAALTDSPQGATANANLGMHLDSHGAMSLAEAVDCGAPPVDPPVACRALLFNIANSLAKRQARTPADVYECTRYAWARLAKPAADIIAIGYSGNISRGGFTAPQWRKEDDGRLSFTAGTTSWLDQEHHLIGHSFTAVLHLAPWRQRNGAIGVEFDGAGQFRIFRGASATVAQRWFPCV